MKERATRRCRKTVVMPPTLRYRSNSNSRSKRRSNGRMRMRHWLEDLLDRRECRGLSWVDRDKKIFSIVWRHASSHGFEESEHGDVFYRWAKHTGKCRPNQAKQHSSYKSNFRCAVHSLKDCIELTKTGDKKGERAKRTFQFIDPSHPLYKKKKNSRRVHADQDLSDASDAGSYTAIELSQIDCTSSSSASSSSSPAPVASFSQAQALFSGETLSYPLKSSPKDSISGVSDESISHLSQNFNLSCGTITPNTPDSAVPKLDLLLEGSSLLSYNLMKTETNADGITTIILPKNIVASRKMQNNHISVDFSLVPQLISQTDSPYKLYGNHLNPRLNCGGNVKIMNSKIEILPLSIPTIAIPVQETQQMPVLDLDVASYMELTDEHLVDFFHPMNNDQQFETTGQYMSEDNLEEPSVITEPIYPDNFILEPNSTS